MRFHDTLNDKIWQIDNNNEIRPEVKDKLNEIADAFIEFIDIPDEAILDMVITGSSASYNYNEHSDLDLHIIVDYDKIHEDCPLVEGYLGALKNTFNKEHDIFIHGVPVELYAEKKDQGTVHNGLYSLKDEKWIDIPRKIPPTTNDAAVEAKYQEIKDMVDKCDDSEAANELLEKIYKMRKAGLSEVGEFSTENLAFKKLRNDGCMDKLRQLKKEKIDKQLSLESYNEGFKKLTKTEQEIEKILQQNGFKTSEVYKDKGTLIKLWYVEKDVKLDGSQHEIGTKVEGKDFKEILKKLQVKFNKNESINEEEITNIEDAINEYIQIKNISIMDIDIDNENIIDTIVNAIIDYTNGKINPKPEDICITIEKMQSDWEREYSLMRDEWNIDFNEDMKTEYAIKKFLKKYGFATQEDLYNNIGTQPFIIDNTVKELLKQNKIKFDDTTGKVNGWRLNENKNDIVTKINNLINKVNKTKRLSLKNKKEFEPFRLEEKSNDGQINLILYRGNREMLHSTVVGNTLLGDDIIGFLNSLTSPYMESYKIHETSKDIICTVQMPINDKFIDQVDVYETDEDNLVEIKIVGKNIEGKLIPIYVANGYIDKIDGEWIMGPTINDYVYDISGQDEKEYILNSWRDFFDNRYYKLEELVKEVIKKLNIDLNEKVEETPNYMRTRLEEPNTCKKGSFRTKEVNDKGDKIVLCKDKDTGKLKAQSKLKKKHESITEENKNNYKTSDFSELNTEDLHCHGIYRYGGFEKYNKYGAFDFICYNLQNKNVYKMNLINNENFEIWTYKDSSDKHEVHIIVAPKKEVTIKEISKITLKAKNILDKKLIKEDYTSLCDKVDNANKDIKQLIKDLNPIKEGYKENIYNPTLIQQAYYIEHEWYKEEGADEEDVHLPQIMLFIIEDKEIKNTKKINRKSVYNYKGADNEYALVRSRDTGWIIDDYYLQNVKDFVKSWKESYSATKKLNNLIDEIFEERKLIKEVFIEPYELYLYKEASDDVKKYGEDYELAKIVHFDTEEKMKKYLNNIKNSEYVAYEMGKREDNKTSLGRFVSMSGGKLC